jgi:hypothetical protein
LSLDQDALSDAKKDLSRAGGDLHSTIQRLLEEHEAGTHANAVVSPEAPPTAARTTATLASQLCNWAALRDRRKQLLAAEDEATATASALTQAHQTLSAQMKQQRVSFRAARQFGDAQQAPAALSHVQQIAEDEKSLSDFDRRIKDGEDLSGVYRDWATLVANRQQRSTQRLRIASHRHALEAQPFDACTRLKYGVPHRLQQQAIESQSSPGEHRTSDSRTEREC